MAIRRSLRRERPGTLGPGASKHAADSPAADGCADAQRLRIAGHAWQSHGSIFHAPCSTEPQSGLSFAPQTPGRAWAARVNLWIPNYIAKATQPYTLFCLHRLNLSTA